MRRYLTRNEIHITFKGKAGCKAPENLDVSQMTFSMQIQQALSISPFLRCYGISPRVYYLSIFLFLNIVALTAYFVDRNVRQNIGPCSICTARVCGRRCVGQRQGTESECRSQTAWATAYHAVLVTIVLCMCIHFFLVRWLKSKVLE